MTSVRARALEFEKRNIFENSSSPATVSKAETTFKLSSATAPVTLTSPVSPVHVENPIKNEKRTPPPPPPPPRTPPPKPARTQLPPPESQTEPKHKADTLSLKKNLEETLSKRTSDFVPEIKPVESNDRPPSRNVDDSVNLPNGSESQKSTRSSSSTSSLLSMKMFSNVFSSSSNVEYNEENTEDLDNDADEDNKPGIEENGTVRHILRFTGKGYLWGSKSIEVNLYKARVIVEGKIYKCKRVTQVILDLTNAQVTIQFSGKVKSQTLYLETPEEAERLAHYIEYLLDSTLRLRNLYDQIHIEGLGRISPSDLARVMKSVGLPSKSENIDKMLSLATIAADTVDFYGFFHVFLSVPVLNMQQCLYEWFMKSHNTPIFNVQLLEYEEIHSNEEDIFYTLCPGKNFENSPFLRGKLILTNYQVLIRSYDTTSRKILSTKLSIPDNFRLISMPYSSIHKIRLITEPFPLLNIVSEHYFSAFIWFPKTIVTNPEKIDSYMNAINNIINSNNYMKTTFAFNYQPSPAYQGIWPSLTLEQEFARQGLMSSNSNWKIIENENYNLCPSYPRKIVVPVECTQKHINGSIKYRSSGRFPAITYIHRNSAVLARCAQPLAGVFRKSSVEDVHLLTLFRMKGTFRNETHCRLYIVDARSVVASMGNALMGKGTENVTAFDNTELVHCSIENIHEMRSCAKQLSEYLSPSYHPFGDYKEVMVPPDPNVSPVIAWLRHVRQVLTSAVLVTEKMALEESSVVVHCSDGWDRTTQICALAQVLLDPYFRTIEGFAVLIEKDWCAFGHKFHDRLGKCKYKPDERSPIFIQFLDCVFQIISQFPCAFEFNQDFLVFIADQSISGLYGNFIGNNEKERVQEYQVFTKTRSIWNDAFSQKKRFTNPFYDNKNKEVIWPTVVLHEMRLWTYWSRWLVASKPN